METLIHAVIRLAQRALGVEIDTLTRHEAADLILDGELRISKR